MCLLLVLWRTSAAAPVMVAANREEFFDRPFDPPTLDPGPPRVLAGRDRRAGGTWLGVNEHGLVVAVTNRFGEPGPEGAPSRGTLCRRLLACPTATAAAELAARELGSGRYAGANYVCLDRAAGLVVQGGRPVEVLPLTPGLHLLTNGNLNDPDDMRQKYARSLFAPRFPRTIDDFVKASRAVLSTGPDAAGERTILVKAENRGTVASTILALAQPAEPSQLHFAAGSPDRTEYQDLSDELRRLLAG